MTSHSIGQMPIEMQSGEKTELLISATEKEPCLLKIHQPHTELQCKAQNTATSLSTQVRKTPLPGQRTKVREQPFNHNIKSDKEAIAVSGWNNSLTRSTDQIISHYGPSYEGEENDLAKIPW